MIKFVPRHGMDNTRFVESRLKKLKKIYNKDKDLKQTQYRPYHTKKSQKRHDEISKRIYIRKKFGV